MHTETQTSFREQTHYQCWNLQNLLQGLEQTQAYLSATTPSLHLPLSTCLQYTPSSLEEIWQGLGLYIAAVQTEQNNKQ